MSKQTLLAEPYPTAEQWRKIVEQFDSRAIAHKLLLAQIPYVFHTEPLKFSLFRRAVADAFSVDPSCVYIVGSAMSGRSLKGDEIEKLYSAENDSDIDTLIVSEHLFATHVMESLDWVRDATRGQNDDKGKLKIPKLSEETISHIYSVSNNASAGIWRPDSLPFDAPVTQRFFDRFSKVGLKTLGLQISDDTVAKVAGRIARSFDDAVENLAKSIRRLQYEFKNPKDKGSGSKQTKDKPPPKK